MSLLKLGTYLGVAAVVLASRVSVGQGVAVTNVQDGETIRYPVVLLRGTADGTGSIYVLNENNPRPDGRTSASIVDGRFISLVELVPGKNNLRLVAPLESTHLTLFYKSVTTSYRVNVVMISAEDGDTTYMTFFEKDPQNYTDKLDTAAKLLQTVTAECMNDAGYGRRTFALDLDDEGRVRVHTLRLSQTASELHGKSGQELWRLIRRYLAERFDAKRQKNIVIMAFTRKDPNTGKLYAHTALGGGSLGLFGSGSMCSWPDSIRDVPRVFSDPTPVDGQAVHDDSNGRGTVWGLASTTMGAVLHETAHTFGLPHVRDPLGVMSRGFDHLNRVLTVVEPPRRGDRKSRSIADAEIMRWTPTSAARLAASPWFRPDEQPPSETRPVSLRRIIARGAQPSWSPDRKRIVFSRGGGLHVLTLTSGETTQLTDAGKDPSWAPSGSLIAYVQHDGEAEEVWCVQPDGEGSRKCGDGGFPHWSADGRTLHFHSRRDGSILALDTVEPSSEPSLVIRCPSSWYPRVSPDGTRVALGSQEQLIVIDCSSGKTIATWPTPGCRSVLPGWSPGGNRIVFGGFGPEGFGLWVFSLSHRRAARVLEGGFTMPAFSSDGEMLSFDDRGRDGGGVWVMETKDLPSFPPLAGQK